MRRAFRPDRAVAEDPRRNESGLGEPATGLLESRLELDPIEACGDRLEQLVGVRFGDCRGRPEPAERVGAGPENEEGQDRRGYRPLSARSSVETRGQPSSETDDQQAIDDEQSGGRG